MGHRILVLLLSAAAMCVPHFASALGLGEITLKSALNQPLNAEIKLLELRDLTENEILVGLASAEEFNRVGVDRPYFLTDLKFRVQMQGADGPVIQVTSSKPVKEPFLNFVMQAQWPSGRLLREYTLLMDLPVFSGQQSQPVVAAKANTPSKPNTQTIESAPSQSSQGSNAFNPRSSFDEAPARPTVSQAPDSGAAQRRSTAPSVEPTSYGDSQYGPVQANDTLWEIARQVRPDRAVSIQQTMLALQRLNPEAFINDNINLLRKGQILRVPDREQIVEYSKQEAVQEVAIQNTQWSGDPNGGYRSDVGAQLEGSRSFGSSNDQSVAVEGRVKLSSPEDVSDSVSGRGAGAGSSSVDALENELAITLEQLDKTERENTDLKSHIESLEEQISTMERMIEISSEDLRAMELAAEKNRQLASVDDSAELEESGVRDLANTEVDMVVDFDVDTEMSDLDNLDLDDSVESASDFEEDALAESDLEVTAEPTAEPTPAPKVEPTKVVSAPKPVEKGIVELILDNVIFIVGGLVAIVLAVFLFMRMRGSSDDMDGQEDDFLSQPVFDELPTEVDDFEETAQELDLDDLSEDTPEEQPVQEAESAAEAQTEDVVAEADIYIAYAKYDQAEEMLLKALEREPEDSNIRVKLLEVYATQQDAGKFDPHFARLLTTADSDAKQRGHQLREGIAGAEPFDENLYDVSAVAASHLASEEIEESLTDLDSQLEAEVENDFGELTLDLDGVNSDENGLDLADDLLSDSAEESLEESLDFELDLGGGEGDSGDDLEFDLDIGEPEEAADEFEIADSLGDEFAELDLDLDESNEDSASLELDIDDSVIAEEGLSADDFALDFDELETATESKDDSPEAFEADLDGLDFDLDDDDLELETGSDLGDLNLGDIDDESESLSLDDQLDVSSLGATGTFDLSEMAELEADLGMNSDASEGGALDSTGLSDDLPVDIASGDEASIEIGDPELAVNDEQEDNSVDIGDDDLDFTGQLDLSSLDEELNALTSDLGVEEADIASLESVDPIEELTGHVAKDETLTAQGVMEEPMTEFDDFEQELEADLDEPELLDEPEVDSAAVSELVEGSAAASLGDSDSLFDEAIADVPESDLEFNIPEIDPDSDDDDLGFLSDSDETATKLDLARAYIDMGDAEGAKDILDEIIKEGNDQQKQEAESLLARV